MAPSTYPDLFEVLNKKGELKQTVYQNTLDSIKILKKVMDDLLAEYHKLHPAGTKSIPFSREDMGDFEVHLQFAGDVLGRKQSRYLLTFSISMAGSRLSFARKNLLHTCSIL